MWLRSFSKKKKEVESDEEEGQSTLPMKKKVEPNSSIIKLPHLGGADRQLDDSDGSFQEE